VLAPYRGERIVQQIPVKIPTSASKGTLRILVSDGETLDHIGRSNPAFGRKKKKKKKKTQKKKSSASGIYYFAA